MKISRPFRSIALVTVLLIALAACGQHAGVHAAGGALVNGVTPGASNAPGVVPTNSLGQPVTPGGQVPGATVPGAPAPGTNPSAPGAPAAACPAPCDRTGITNTTITIGLHAPTTGAAPIQPSSFISGKDLFWKYLKNDLHKSVYGRSVEVIFKDDHYTPTQAVAVCSQMASQGAFLLIGGAGADQINACDQYAQQYGIPYLSPGVQEAGLSTRNNYFAVTMTYPGQMPLLVQMLKAKNKTASLDKFGLNGGAPDGKITLGFVRPNTAGFDDADNALHQAVTAAGWTYKDFTVQKEGNASDAQSVATSARTQGIDIIVPITAPNFTVLLASQIDSEQGYRPQWAGVAITDNINQFLQNVQSCGKHQSSSTVNGALWFSPWPAWKSVMAGKYDPDLAKAANKYAPNINTATNGGDLLLALWGISRGLYQMFLKAGPGMSRGTFISSTSTFSYASGAYPNLAFSPGNPFGAHGVFLLKADCTQSDAQFIEDPQFPGLRQSF